MSLRTRLLVGLAVLVLAAVATAGWSVLGVAPVARLGDGVFYYAPLRAGAGGRVVAAARLRLPGDADVARALRGARALLVAVTLFDGGLVLLFGALFIRRVVEPIEALSAT